MTKSQEVSAHPTTNLLSFCDPVSRSGNLGHSPKVPWMIQKLPSWTLDRPAGTCAWPDRVRLVGRFLLAQWYCLNRNDGSVVWERDLPCVNFITGVHDGAILCATIVPGWKSGVGACALRLADGELYWSEPLSPVSLEESEFLCMDGTVRDLKTARVVGQRPSLNECAALEANGSLELSLRLSKILGKGPLELVEGIFVTGEPGGGDYTATSKRGRVLWHYAPAEAGWYCGASNAERFVAPPYIYLLASRTPPTRRIDAKRSEFVPTEWYWLTLDIRLGEVVQEFDLGTWNSPCAINDVDEDGAILSFENVLLAYHPRQSAGNVSAG